MCAVGLISFFSAVGLGFQFLRATVETLNHTISWCFFNPQFVRFGVQLQLKLQLLTLLSYSNLALTSILKLKLKLNLRYDFTNVENIS